MVIARQSPWATTRTGPEPAPPGILLPFDSSEKRLLSVVLRSEFYYMHMTLGVGNLPGGGHRTGTAPAGVGRSEELAAAVDVSRR